MKFTWTKDSPGNYTATNGARVYRYEHKAYATEWGVQLPHWTTGDGGFRSMKEAKSYVENHSNPLLE